MPPGRDIKKDLRKYNFIRFSRACFSIQRTFQFLLRKWKVRPESRTTTNGRGRGRDWETNGGFILLGVIIVIAVLLSVPARQTGTVYGKTGLTGDEKPPAVRGMSYFYGKINAASGQKGLLAEHGSHGSRLQMKDGGSAETRQWKEKRKAAQSGKKRKKTHHRDDTGENSRLDGKSAERKKMKFERWLNF